MIFFLVWFDAICPGKQFFSHVGTEQPLLGYYQYFFFFFFGGGGGEGICLSQGHNTATRVGHEPPTSEMSDDVSIFIFIVRVRQKPCELCHLLSVFTTDQFRFSYHNYFWPRKVNNYLLLGRCHGSMVPLLEWR